MKALKGVKYLVIDALRKEKHISHLIWKKPSKFHGKLVQKKNLVYAYQSPDGTIGFNKQNTA